MTARDVTFDSDGCTLAGTFAEAAEPVAAALLVVGSGKTDRDSDVHLPLHQMIRGGITRQIADALLTARVSSLRYDKRGIGASGGDHMTTGMPQRLADARAALGWLSAQASGLPLIAIGHSEGTYYAEQMAADREVAGAVLLSGPARSGGEVLAYQVEKMATRMPLAARVIMRLMRTDVVRAQRKNQDKIMASTGDVVRVQGQRINARWFRDFVTHDPRSVLAQITVPVLAITGGEDVQVPPDDIEVMRQLVRGPFEGHVAGNLSHMLRPDPDSVSPEVLNLITTWVEKHWGSAANAVRTDSASGGD